MVFMSKIFFMLVLDFAACDKAARHLATGQQVLAAMSALAPPVEDNEKSENEDADIPTTGAPKAARHMASGQQVLAATSALASPVEDNENAAVKKGVTITLRNVCAQAVEVRAFGLMEDGFPGEVGTSYIMHNWEHDVRTFIVLDAHKPIDIHSTSGVSEREQQRKSCSMAIDGKIHEQHSEQSHYNVTLCGCIALSPHLNIADILTTSVPSRASNRMSGTETPATIYETPTVNTETPATIGETPTVNTKTPTINTETPAIIDETPTVTAGLHIPFLGLAEKHWGFIALGVAAVSGVIFLLSFLCGGRADTAEAVESNRNS